MTTPETQGEESPESTGKTASSAVGGPPDAKLVAPAVLGTLGTKSAKTCPRKVV